MTLSRSEEASAGAPFIATSETHGATKRPVIAIEQGDIRKVVDASEAALIKAGLGLYQRDGRIVEISTAIAITADGRNIEVSRIAERRDHALAEDLSRGANFVRFSGANAVPTNPPMWIVKTLRERGSLKFPVLAGVVNAPTMRADGSILSKPGYDRATGLFFDPVGVDFPQIPARPTRDDAVASLALLNDLIGTFPFVADVDRAVALSAILTLVVRRSLPTAPLHGFSAPVAGSGKSKLVDIAAAIATGQEAPVLAQGATEEEMEKRLGGALMAGYPIVSIDNAERPIEGQFLCQALTQIRVRTRTLGKSEVPEISTGAFHAATGNNLRFAGDMTRRAILCSLDPKCERPETRVFECNPVAMAKADRPRYVGACLTILRAYQVAGCPSKVPPLGSFEEWSNLVRGALLWLGCADPVETMDAIRQADPRLSGLETLVAQWWCEFGSEQTTVAEVIKKATAHDDGGFERPDLREALLNVARAGGKIDGRRLGNWLARNAGRIVGGLRFEQCGERSHYAIWRLSGGREPSTAA